MRKQNVQIEVTLFVLVPKIHRKIDFIWESFYTLLSPINRVALVIE